MTTDHKISFEGFSPSLEFERTYTPLEFPAHPDAAFLLDYWRAKESAGGLVIGRDIPSRSISRVLRNLMVNEPTADGHDFYIRVAGTMCLRRYGREVTGLLFSDLFDQPTFEHHCASAYESLRANRPMLLDVKVKRSGIEQAHYEIVRLPVWAPDKAARWSLVGVFFFD